MSTASRPCGNSEVSRNTAFQMPTPIFLYSLVTSNISIREKLLFAHIGQRMFEELLEHLERHGADIGAG